MEFQDLPSSLPANLYIHFPFCRRKCAYCALYSRVGVSQADRDAYVVALAGEIARGGARASGQTGAGFPLAADCRLLAADAFSTVYFGGGSPALCDLGPLFSALQLQLRTSTEFTVELHPLDVTEELLATLKAGGVNRISMGVQSFDDQTLAAMGRGYTIDGALRAFETVKRSFDNAGIDLIVGFPGDPCRFELKRFADLGLRHCSVYSLQNERGLSNVPDDNIVLDEIKRCTGELAELGLERYEISNYAVPGYECRHNLAVWRGEDYIGLGDGACGRIGLRRTKFGKEETVTPEFDAKERALFRLRTREGLDLRSLSHLSNASNLSNILATQVAAGLLTQSGEIYRLTERGTEVCDSILAELV